MAVAPVRGFRFVAGSRRLIFLHWLLALVAALPGWILGRGALTAAVGGRPYFTDAPDPLPLPQLMHLVRAVPGSVWGALVAGLVVAWLGRLALTAAAVEILDPIAALEPARVWRTVCDRGVGYVLPYLRITFVSALFLVVGSVFIGMAFEFLKDIGERQGWSARAMSIQISFWLGLAVLAWASCVGVFAFWARVLMVADGRRSVVRLFGVLMNLSVRRPLVFMVFHFVLSVASVTLATKVLPAWRQSPAGGGAWFVLWLGVLFLQAFLWHWRLRVCRLVLADETRGHSSFSFKTSRPL